MVVIRFFLLIMICTLTNCDKRLDDLVMTKTPYTGDEIRVDGYYYSNLSSSFGVGVAVFFRDGVCIHFFFTPETNDTSQYIETEFLTNEAFINDAKSKPNWIGVFKIAEESIEFETWEAGRNITTFSHIGAILNDTTFLLQERVDNVNNEPSEMNITYRFKEFSPKPDSTNTFIE